MSRRRKLKRRQMVARDHYMDQPRRGEEGMQIWHAIFSTPRATDEFLDDLENICKKHDMRMVLTEQKKQC